MSHALQNSEGLSAVIHKDLLHVDIDGYIEKCLAKLLQFTICLAYVVQEY